MKFGREMVGEKKLGKDDFIFRVSYVIFIYLGKCIPLFYFCW